MFLQEQIKGIIIYQRTPLTGKPRHERPPLPPQICLGYVLNVLKVAFLRLSQCAGSSGLLTIQKRDKNPTLNREVLCAKMRARNENQLPVARDQKRCLRTRQWLLHVADTREGGRAWRQARDEKVIAREDGYTYIAALRSPDLRHTTKREGDTSVTVVTSNQGSS